MKKTSCLPRFLPEVLQAICQLKETGGSDTNKIVSYVKSNGSRPNSSLAPRNLSTQVRRALNHATINGIIKQRAGKFRINTAIFDPYKDCAECRRRKRAKKGKRGKRRRGRRHAVLGLGSGSEGPKLISDSDSDFPVRELRKRKRKQGRRRRRRRGRRNTLQMPGKSIKTDHDDGGDMPGGMIYPDDHKDGDNMVDAVQCGNPDCLCNVRNDHEDMPNFDPQM